MGSLSPTGSLVIQLILLSIALVITLLRFYVPIRMDPQPPGPSDFLAIAGVLCTAGWIATSTVSLRLSIEDQDDATVSLLKVQYISNFFFDIGLFFPKASMIFIYWRIFPWVLTKLRVALYVVTGYLICSALCTLFVDLLYCRPISYNWSLDHQDASVWNSWTVFRLNYSLNLSNDIFIFILPLFLLRGLKNLPPAKWYSVLWIFSLGVVTIIISISRFVWENLDEAITGDNVWCTAEMCGALIIVGLPRLKPVFRLKNDPAMVTAANYSEHAILSQHSSPRRTDMGKHGGESIDSQVTFSTRFNSNSVSTT